MATTAPLGVPAGDCTGFLAALFAAAGLAPGPARRVAAALVEAELQGVPSHGVLQAPVYLRRLRAGTLSPATRMRRVHDGGAVAVFDAGCMLGHLALPQAVAAVARRARRHGIGAVAVRRGGHFGILGVPAGALAARGLFALVMCNTRPMMPAPGGAEPAVGNNPLAIAAPVAGAPPLVLDMAMSAAAMGRIRRAAATGEAIPEGWAVDAGAAPTTDAAAALAGMLLPAAGAKGFGLALMVDLLSGVLSGGAVGAEVASMYADPAQPAHCSWLLLALDPAHFGLACPAGDRVAAELDRLRGLRRRPDAGSLRLPGERGRAARAAAGDAVTLPAALLAELDRLAAEAGLPPLGPAHGPDGGPARR